METSLGRLGNASDDKPVLVAGVAHMYLGRRNRDDVNRRVGEHPQNRGSVVIRLPACS